MLFPDRRQILSALAALGCAPALAETVLAETVRAETVQADTAVANASPAPTFPRRVRHAMGESVIPAPPRRVVSVGYNDQDALYALGIAPVGVHEWFGSYPHATWPWAEPARAALNATPAVQTGFEVDVEWVLAQEPDLIVATFFDLDPGTYALLSAIAPVITRPAAYPAWGAPWQALLAILAEATGTEARATAVTARLEAQVAAAADPRLRGKSGTAAFYTNGRFVIYRPEDGANRLLTALGLHTPDRFAELIGSGSQLSISPERLDLLELDCVLWLVDATSRAEVEALPLYRASRLAREGRSAWADDEMTGALAFMSPLSIPAVLDRLVPQLISAVDGDPAT